MKGIKKVLCYDLYEEKSKAFAELAAKEFGVEAYAAATLEEAMRAGDVITIAASRLKPLILDSTWLKKGVTILLSGPARGDEALWINSRLVYDHVQLHEAYVEEAIASGNKAEYYAGVIGGPIYTLIDEGKIQPLEDSISLGDIVNGKNPGRQNGEENIILIACGMAVYDIAWGYDLYKYSLEKGIGTKLNLWNEPLWK
jgi:ornithine cyclodeaminase/alanine dehydrogenase-like protein (mu-crystallin family)